MKNTRYPFLALALAPTMALAGPVEPAPAPAPIEVEPGSAVSGTLSFDLNTHFVSYGLDVWGVGEDFGTDATFNPSLELAFQLTDSLSWVIGTWWDVNDNAPATLGGRIQEVDIWTGFGYDVGSWSFGAIYQAWDYAGSTEHILDFSIAYDTFLNPALLIHGRVDEGAANATGTWIVPSISYDFEAGPVSFDIPLAAGFSWGENFHFSGADNGFGYLSIGLNASTPLTFIDTKFGEWDIHGGLTYYVTEDDVTGNADDSFLTGNIGISCAF